MSKTKRTRGFRQMRHTAVTVIERERNKVRVFDYRQRQAGEEAQDRQRLTKARDNK